MRAGQMPGGSSVPVITWDVSFPPTALSAEHSVLVMEKDIVFSSKKKERILCQDFVLTVLVRLVRIFTG
jgi:hypothetical protein